MSAFFKSLFSSVGMNEYTQLLGERVLKYPKNICVLCLDPVEYRNPSGCCVECDLLVEMLQNKKFHDDAKIVAETLTQVKPTHKTANLYIDETLSVYVPNTSILSNPEKHLYYACLLTAFCRTRSTFKHGIPTNECELFCAPSFHRHLRSTCDAETEKQLRTTALTALKASFQIPEVKGKMSTFWLFEGGVSASFFTHIEGTDADKGIVFKIVSVPVKSTENNYVYGIFELTEITSFDAISNITNLLDDLPLYILSNDTKNKRAGRVIAYRNPHLDFDHPIDDPAWEKLHQERQEKLAKRTEQERKEQERREKKERQREEQRQLDYQRQKEEKALKLARASLVEAVAKVDADLEKIRKLRELNREVALKNQKIADRKEAEKLAKEAERRHAEKLKQKELERQKFISKKH